MQSGDARALIAGAAGWAAAAPLVRAVGPVVADGSPAAKAVVLALAAGISALTTPLLARLLGWRSAHERVRGIALALGAAQCIDGLVHFYWPGFYSANPRVALGASGSVFAAAGLLGIFSAYA
jgi:hypothetical protein